MNRGRCQRIGRQLTILMAIAMCVSTHVYGQGLPVNHEAEQKWIASLIPLPHEISISNAVAMHVSELNVLARPNAGLVEKQAVEELGEFLQSATDVRHTNRYFEIIVGVADGSGSLLGHRIENIERLKKCPNNEQAYLIQPVGANRLVVVGLHEKGVYYGVQTLIQLLEHRADKDRISLPLARVVDWPDMAERGFWNNDLALIPWMTRLKINFTHDDVNIILRKGAKAECAPLPTNIMALAAARALVFIPHLRHFDFWQRDDYPELIGKGKAAINPNNPSNDRLRCPCASNPLLRQFITDWLISAARQGAREASLWLTEYSPCQCECAACMKNGPRQWELETQACVDAWQEAKRQYPGLVVRIFFTISRDKNVPVAYRCLALVPREIKIEKVYGGARAPFDEYAAKGYWAASYMGHTIPRSFNSGLRFYAAVKTNDVADLYDHKWQGIYCLSGFEVGPERGVFEKKIYNYSFHALAEWGWNVRGRDARQFALSWATRQGYKRPDIVAEWIVAIQPVEKKLDLMNATVTSWATVLQRLIDHKATADLLTTIMPVADCNQAITACDKALERLSACPDGASLEVETRYVRAGYTAMKQVRLLLENAGQSAGTNAAAIRAVAVKQLSASVNEMIGLMNKQVDLLQPLPEKGAGQIKQRHAAMCQDVLSRIELLDSTVRNEQPEAGNKD